MWAADSAWTTEWVEFFFFLELEYSLLVRVASCSLPKVRLFFFFLFFFLLFLSFSHFYSDTVICFSPSFPPSCVTFVYKGKRRKKEEKKKKRIYSTTHEYSLVVSLTLFFSSSLQPQNEMNKSSKISPHKD